MKPKISENYNIMYTNCLRNLFKRTNNLRNTFQHSLQFYCIYRTKSCTTSCLAILLTNILHFLLLYRCKNILALTVLFCVLYRRYHGESKPYTCQVCGSAFANAVELSRHGKCHLGKYDGFVSYTSAMYNSCTKKIG